MRPRELWGVSILSLSWRLLVAIVVCVLMGGCDRDDLIEKFTPHPEAEIGRQAIDDWRTGRLDALRARLSPSMSDGVSDEHLAEVAAPFPRGEPRSVKVVGATSEIEGEERRYKVLYEYEFDGRWLLASAALEQHGDEAAEVVGLHGEMLPRSLEQTNAFSFTYAGGLHLLMLFLVIAVPVFCVVACIVCIRTPIPERKALWALFTLVGMFSIGFNWTTGAISFNALSIELLGASIGATPYGPWYLNVSLPIGAILFFLRRKVFLTGGTQAATRNP